MLIILKKDKKVKLLVYLSVCPSNITCLEHILSSFGPIICLIFHLQGAFGKGCTMTLNNFLDQIQDHPFQNHILSSLSSSNFIQRVFVGICSNLNWTNFPGLRWRSLHTIFYYDHIFSCLGPILPRITKRLLAGKECAVTFYQV